METTLHGTRRLLALLVALIACSQLGAAQLVLTKDAANLKDINELSAHYLPASYANPNLTLADLQRVLENKCQKANAALPASEAEAVRLSNNIQRAGEQLSQCVTGLVNITVVLNEVERARPNGDLDVVFESYCRRLPNMTNCMREFNAALLPCLTREERAHNAMMQRIINKLLDFVCYKNGDQIALFVAEQGPECLEQHKTNVGDCIQKTFGHYLPSELNVTALELPELVLGTKQCIELNEFKQCVVRHLETCDNVTPSNVIESMFRYVLKESSCQQAVNRVTREGAELRSGASSVWTAASAVAAVSLASQLLTMFAV
ncbi:hypothetical protein KR222_002311 [Zaprionus bogoriensis]|nr:hypothetical protein KR222_002311 [Zaprionus bogoriensis]